MLTTNIYNPTSKYMANRQTITRTISIKLITSSQQSDALAHLQYKFNEICNKIVPFAAVKRCWNRVDLHNLCYYKMREKNDLGSQMVCNAIKIVIDAYKTLKIKPNTEVPIINFKSTSSVHYDKRTYSLKGKMISLYTLSGRIQVPMKLGDFQKKYLQKGIFKEAELIYRNGYWFFNLVLDLPAITLRPPANKVVGVDLGEINLAATSLGKIYPGGELRYKRDKFVAHRKRLLSNGSKSAKRRLKKISGKEARRVKQVSHAISKDIVKNVDALGYDTIAMENLTHVNKRMKLSKRLNFRLHGWAWKQMQVFVEYKARAKGINVIYVNPAYTSQTCSECEAIGIRSKHRFTCQLCGIHRHSDLNASHNIRRIAMSADVATGTVNCPNILIN